jgi:hypothetical protein
MKKANPWAVCGRRLKRGTQKYERCVLAIKRRQHMRIR